MNIFQKIYKLKVLKSELKLFYWGGPELVKLQNQYIKVIEKILKEQYKEILEEISKNTEVKYNDIFIDQSQFIEKDFSDNLEKISNMISKAFSIGKSQLNKLIGKEVTVEASFGLSADDALKYANDYAWKLVKWLDETSKKRINDLITKGIDKGWGYQKISEALKIDFAFSDYRARLIASNEIGTAYIQGKNEQFSRYRSEYGQTGWKNWISHKDDVTTAECLANDEEGWIAFDQEFQDGHKTPPRFPWCRCNITYRLFKPE